MYGALHLPIRREDIDMRSEATAPAMAFVARLAENGYCVREELLHALNLASPDTLAEISKRIDDALGMNLNWAPLVKGWQTPTGETLVDHFITFFANLAIRQRHQTQQAQQTGENLFGAGTFLPCGHFIPEGTFHLERYNGCPFCGTPFRTADFVYKGQGSKLKELRLFTTEDMEYLMQTLLSSAVPLDETQKFALEILLQNLPLPDNACVGMKETAMLVVKVLVEQDRADEASKLLTTPADILRFLWYRKTGKVRIIEPKTFIRHGFRRYGDMPGNSETRDRAVEEKKKYLKLKYDRKTCLQASKWLNAVPMSARQAAENMNPKRGMWVRFIHALRLGEYSRKKGFGHLAEILDVFYRKDYTTWQGQVDKARSEHNAEEMLALLKERPGLFSRCLFAAMLRFDTRKVLAAFNEIADQIAPRLLLSLGNTAGGYFSKTKVRVVKTITGMAVRISNNQLISCHSDEHLEAMARAVNDIYKASMARHFAAQSTASKTIYIDPMLRNIPVGVGDRSTTIQDTSCALQGTRFPVEGDAVRLFLQWGKGLHAQHLDMDLSARIAFADGNIKDCAYYSLTCIGAKHSGDIRSIPEMVGTAEYIELSIPELIESNALYVTFSCNAYSISTLSPNLVVGWMDSANKMSISEETGVAYDPSCVQHMVRISEKNLSRGLVFGVLDVAKREIIWLEMPNMARTIGRADIASVMALLKGLVAKLTVGELLDMKAKAQNLQPVDTPEEADEAYTYEWALNPAEVSMLLNASLTT